MSSNKAPSAGQKINAGSSAPLKQEKPGAIDSSSLAAESLRSGGGFSANESATPGSQPVHGSHTRAPGTAGTAHTGGGGSLQDQASYGGAAPSYVISQFRVDDKPPHGENLTEGGFQGSGTDGGPLPEPGSNQDPSRLAEQAMLQGKGGRPAKGEGIRAGGSETEQPFGALKVDESI